jgi:predicted peptidase
MKTRLKVAAFGLVCVLRVSCSAFIVKKVYTGQHPNIFTGNKSTSINRTYLLYIPGQYKKEEKLWPLILYLHGASLRGSDIEKVKRYGLPAMLETRRDFPFFVISPQCLDGKDWSDTESLIALVDEICSEYSIDADRIYLTGVSLGGNGTWYLAYCHPERFAAAAPICGVADTAWAPSFRNLPVWVFHGLQDTKISINYSFDMVNAIIAHGGTAKYTFYPDDGHDIVTKTYTNNELYTWFLDQRRKN